MSSAPISMQMRPRFAVTWPRICSQRSVLPTGCQTLNTRPLHARANLSLSGTKSTAPLTSCTMYLSSAISATRSKLKVTFTACWPERVSMIPSLTPHELTNLVPDHASHGRCGVRHGLVVLPLGWCVRPPYRRRCQKNSGRPSPTGPNVASASSACFICSREPLLFLGQHGHLLLCRLELGTHAVLQGLTPCLERAQLCNQLPLQRLQMLLVGRHRGATEDERVASYCHVGSRKTGALFRPGSWVRRPGSI